MWLGERVARWLAVPTSECSQECFRMVGTHASGISIPLSLLMLLGWRRIWIASLTRRVCQCGSLSMHLTSFQLGPCPVALACSATAEVWQRARRTSLSCSFILSCTGLPVSPMYTASHSPHGIRYTTPSRLPGGTGSFGRTRWLRRVVSDLKTVPFTLHFLKSHVGQGKLLPSHRRPFIVDIEPFLRFLWSQSGGWFKGSIGGHFQSREHFFKWCGSRLTVMQIQLPNWDLGLWDYLGFKSISYCTHCYIGGEGEVHNCCVDWANRIVK